MLKRLFLFCIITSVISGCAVNSGSTVEDKRANVLAMRDEAIDHIAKNQSNIRQKISNASGYAVFSNANVNVIFASFSGGYGVVHNNANGQNTYMRTSEAGIGLGIGVKDVRVLMIFKTPTALDRFIESGWVFGAQADATAITSDKGGATNAEVVADDIEIYQVTEAGLALQATVKGSKFWVDKALN